MLRNRWLVLTLLALAQFMVVLDVTIVNIALPHIQNGLHLSGGDLQWVVNAYTLVFGGFLLLGGRAADLLGRRALFIAGLIVFCMSSLAAGLSSSATMLIAARASQGLGGALLSPAALSLLTVTFAHGHERNIALGIWGALAGIGGTLGVVAGGLLVDRVGWEWVFFVNVPIGVALIALSPLVIAESRADRSSSRSFDVLGALLGTGGLLLLVFGVVRTQVLGWGSAEVIASLTGGLGLLAAFVAAERRAANPLVPLRLFRARGLRTASVALALNGAAFLSMFFLTAIFLQQVRGLSALQTGIDLLPMGAAAILAAVASSQLGTRVGTRWVQAAGALLSLIGLLLLAAAGPDGPYASSLLPGLVLYGAGIISVGVPAQIAAVAEARHDEAGATSGIVNTAYQVGAALGLAVITTIANSHLHAALAAGTPRQLALTDGFQRGLVAAAVLALVNIAVSLSSPSIAPTADQLAIAGSAA